MMQSRFGGAFWLLIDVLVGIVVLLQNDCTVTASFLPCSSSLRKSPGSGIRNDDIYNFHKNINIRGSTSLGSLFGEQAAVDRKKAKKKSSSSGVSWQVYIDQSKSSLDRGGSATLDAFVGLSPPSMIKIIPAILPKASLSSKSTKGPMVRCISNVAGRPSLDVANVDSVDKVYRILTRHMRVQGVNFKACECLKWKYKGNGHLEAGKVSLAIDAYNKALETGVTQQEGVVLLLRSSAYLQQAQSHKFELQSTVEELNEMAPTIPNLMVGLQAQQQPKKNKTKKSSSSSSSSPALTISLLERVVSEGKRQEAQFRRTQYRHGLYQYSLLQAAQDSLRATELLPTYSTSWLRAGEILSELWKVKESTQYYERALALDETLQESLVPIMKKLQRRQELLEQAKAYGWPEDTLRLALDCLAEVP